MKASPERKPRHRRLDLGARPFGANWRVALLVAASMVAFTPSLAKEPDTQGDVQASAKIDEEASGLSKDYRLAPGDRLTIVVYDQPQLSGQFDVDGGGGILLPLAGAVSLSGLTLAEAQQLIQDRFADGVLVQPAVSLRITDYRPIFVTGNVRKPGSYRFTIGQSVKAAVAAAGGEGVPIEQSSHRRHVRLHHHGAAVTAARGRSSDPGHTQGAPRSATRWKRQLHNAGACRLGQPQRRLRSRVLGRERHFFAVCRNVSWASASPAEASARVLKPSSMR